MFRGNYYIKPNEYKIPECDPSRQRRRIILAAYGFEQIAEPAEAYFGEQEKRIICNVVNIVLEFEAAALSTMSLQQRIQVIPLHRFIFCQTSLQYKQYLCGTRGIFLVHVSDSFSYYLTIDHTVLCIDHSDIMATSHHRYRRYKELFLSEERRSLIVAPYFSTFSCLTGVQWDLDQSKVMKILQVLF